MKFENRKVIPFVVPEGPDAKPRGEESEAEPVVVDRFYQEEANAMTRETESQPKSKS
jgi:hypothetical protein